MNDTFQKKEDVEDGVSLGQRIYINTNTNTKMKIGLTFSWMFVSSYKRGVKYG